MQNLSRNSALPLSSRLLNQIDERRNPRTRATVNQLLDRYLQVLDVYDRRNVLFYFYQMDQDPPTRTGLSMLPVLPTLGVEVSF